MPHMNGHELAGKLSSLRPDMKVLYVSGYSDNDIGDHGVLDPRFELLQKPFTPQTLARKIRDVIREGKYAYITDHEWPARDCTVSVRALGEALAAAGCDPVVRPGAGVFRLSRRSRRRIGTPARIEDHAADGTKRPDDQKKWGKLEGDAVWYDVPANSLAKRRAGKDELTAAHNRLPLGTMVRVTHLGNGKNVIVRITDRGINKPASASSISARKPPKSSE